MLLTKKLVFSVWNLLSKYVYNKTYIVANTRQNNPYHVVLETKSMSELKDHVGPFPPRLYGLNRL